MRNPLLHGGASFCRPVSLLLMLVAMLLLPLGACTSLKNIGREATSGGELKKRIGLTFFENRTGLDSRLFRENFDRRLNAKIAAGCSDILPVSPEGNTFLDYLNLPRLSTGLVDSHALAESGRKYGLEAVVSGSLLEMRVEKEVSGSLWFKNSSPTVELLIGAEVYDTETGAKILDEHFSRKSEISEMEAESLQAGESSVRPLLNSLLQQVADAAGDAICNALERQPWKGFVISVNGDKVILSSGKDTGLLPGDVLQVYDSRKTISGYGGQRFFLPGGRIGEIRITAVYPNRSDAVVVSGIGIGEGCTVKLR